MLYLVGAESAILYMQQLRENWIKWDQAILSGIAKIQFYLVYVEPIQNNYLLYMCTLMNCAMSSLSFSIVYSVHYLGVALTVKSCTGHCLTHVQDFKFKCY